MWRRIFFLHSEIWRRIGGTNKAWSEGARGCNTAKHRLRAWPVAQVRRASYRSHEDGRRRRELRHSPSSCACRPPRPFNYGQQKMIRLYPKSSHHHHVLPARRRAKHDWARAAAYSTPLLAWWWCHRDIMTCHILPFPFGNKTLCQFSLLQLQYCLFQQKFTVYFQEPSRRTDAK
jgi:hypothetical protein